MTHPYRTFTVNEESVKKGPGSGLAHQIGMAVLPFAGRHHLATEVSGQKLHAVADAKNRNIQVKDGLFNGGSPFVVN